MAEITSITRVGDRVPYGRFFRQIYRVAVGAAAADEFFRTDFSSILSVMSATLDATTGGAFCFKRNITGGTGGSTAAPGVLSLESTVAGTADVVVLGSI